jgi:hypothetical protein
MARLTSEDIPLLSYIWGRPFAAAELAAQQRMGTSRESLIDYGQRRFGRGPDQYAEYEQLGYVTPTEPFPSFEESGLYDRTRAQNLFNEVYSPYYERMGGYNKQDYETAQADLDRQRAYAEQNRALTQANEAMQMAQYQRQIQPQRTQFQEGLVSSGMLRSGVGNEGYQNLLTGQQEGLENLQRGQKASQLSYDYGLGTLEGNRRRTQTAYERGLTEADYAKKAQQEQFYGSEEQRARNEYERRRAARYGYY